MYKMYIFYEKVFVFCGLFVIVSDFVCCSSLENVSSDKYAVATTEKIINEDDVSKTRYEQGLEDYDEAQERIRQARGMDMDDDDYHIHDLVHDDHPKEEKKEMVEQKAVKDDAWGGYYDFLINEGSFKFWAVFQLVTAVLLIYSAFAAVYYAKFNVITTDYDYYDDFLGRSNTESPLTSMWSGLSSQTFQRIFDAISSKKYT